MLEVSIITPSYNYERYIYSTIKSDLNQTFQDMEIIVAGNGSTDRTRDIVSSYEFCVRLIPQAISKVYAARNRGILEADDECNCLMDSNDYWITLKSIPGLVSFTTVHLYHGSQIITVYIQISATLIR